MQTDQPRAHSPSHLLFGAITLQAIIALITLGSGTRQLEIVPTS